MLSIRQADTNDRAALEALQFHASMEWEDYRPQLLAHPEVSKIPVEQLAGGSVFVAELDGSIAGFGVLVQRTDGAMELDGLFVEPTLWRKGIGKSLMREAERRARGHGSRALHVIANPRAEAFYLACGFTFVGLHETAFGTARTMQKVVMP